MSEHEYVEFSQNGDPELDAIVYGFSNGAYQLYNWLKTNISDDRYALLFNREAANRVGLLSDSFARTAVGVDQYFQNRDLTRDFISSVWYADEVHRVTTFSALAADAEFEALGAYHINRKISDFQKQADLDPDDFICSLKNEYGHSLGVDVANLIRSLFQLQEAKILSLLPELPLSTPESVHVGLVASRIKEVRDEVGKRILNQVVDGKFVRYGTSI